MSIKKELTERKQKLQDDIRRMELVIGEKKVIINAIDIVIDDAEMGSLQELFDGIPEHNNGLGDLFGDIDEEKNGFVDLSSNIWQSFNLPGIKYVCVKCGRLHVVLPKTCYVCGCGVFKSVIPHA